MKPGTWRWDYRPRYKQFLSGLIAILALVPIVAGVQYSLVKNSAKDHEWVVHTYAVLSEISELESALRQARSNARHFAANGSERNAGMTEEARKSVNEQLTNLRKLTADNDFQR